jgi:surface carbohydrate biosynthesis protein
MIRAFRLLTTLLKLRWRILPPRKANALLYFVTGSEVIKPYFAKDELQILDLREHEVNISVALLCIFDRDLSAQNYAVRYIKIVEPKLIVTFIDNFPAFFQLKKQFPKIQTMLIQNGIRSERGDLFGKLLEELQLEGNHVDHMFVFGSAVGLIYNKYISGNIIPIGSFKNNLVKRDGTKSRSIAYISTYRPGISGEFIVPDSAPNNPVTYEQITVRRETTIIFVAEYCRANNLELIIVGKDEDFVAENLYYQKLLKDYSWTLNPRKTAMNSYGVIDNSEIVVFTSSTLGYEALARGIKTAALLIDAKLLDADALKFGWPVKVKDDGKFWTHQFDEKRFGEILDYLLTVSDADWDKIRSETIGEIICYDENNSKFVETLTSLRAEW